jgi:hypothetical protein
MNSEVYKRKLDTPDELLPRILDATVRIKKGEDQLRQPHAIFAHELQSTLRLTVGFWDINCEL